MTIKSRVFGSRGPQKPHLVRPHGLGGEIADLRADVEAGFLLQQRDGSLADPAYATQTSWYIDPTLGNDNATGATVGAPIKTQEEMRKRIAGNELNVAVTVFITDTLASANFDFRFGVSGSLVVKSTKTLTTLYTGSITAITAIGADAVDITDSALPADWGASALVNTQSSLFRRIRMTSGTNSGAIAYPFQDLTTKKVRCSPFCKPDLTLPLAGPPVAPVTPQVGDTFVVETDLAEITDLRVDLVGTSLVPSTGGSSRALFLDISLPNVTQRRTVIGMTERVVNPPVVHFNRCDVGRIGPSKSTALGINGSKMSGAANGSGQGVFFIGASLICQVFGITGGGGGSIFYADTVFALGGRLTVDTSGVRFERCAFYGATGAGLTIRAGASARSESFVAADLIYGSANTTYGIDLRGGGTLSYAVKPTVTGTLGDTRSGAKIRPYAQVPFIDGNHVETLRAGIKGAVTASATNYPSQIFTEESTDVLGFTMKVAGVLSDLRVDAGTAPGGAVSDAHTVRVNGVDSIITANLVGAAVTVSDAVNRVVVAAGDRVSFKIVTGGGSVAANVRVAVDFAGQDGSGGKIVVA